MGANHVLKALQRFIATARRFAFHLGPIHDCTFSKRCSCGVVMVIGLVPWQRNNFRWVAGITVHTYVFAGLTYGQKRNFKRQRRLTRQDSPFVWTPTSKLRSRSQNLLLYF
jgi:hypothetical protein